MRYNQTDAYKKVFEKAFSEVEIASQLSKSTSYEQFMMNYTITFGPNVEMNFNTFMLLFGYSLETKENNMHILDILFDVASKETILDNCFKMKLFWNTCGRWIKYNYSTKDKTRYLKLAKLMGLAATKQL